MADKKPAPKQKTKAVNYRELNQELAAILQDLQREDLDIDLALKQYQRGLAIVQVLEDYLKTAENSLKT